MSQILISFILDCTEWAREIVMIKAVLKHSFKAILVILLLQFSSTAVAFTLIRLESILPSSTITDSSTFNTRIQPITGAIRAHLLTTKRGSMARLAAQADVTLATNTYVETTTDFEFLKASSHGGTGINSARNNVWVNSTFVSFENDFSRTSFDGSIHMLVFGFDYTISDRYIFGIALNKETSKVNTDFNIGNQSVDGFGINPYFAFLLSDAWSLDLGLGYGVIDTDQSRTIAGPVVVTSNFESVQNFVTMNLTGTSITGNWYLTSALGLLVANKEQDSYVESDATAVTGQDIDLKQFNLLGEAAYSHSVSESYVGLIYENLTEFEEIQLLGNPQPANDDDSFLIMLGWRYYGSDIIANFEINSRVSQDETSEYSILSTLRIDL